MNAMLADYPQTDMRKKLADYEQKVQSKKKNTEELEDIMQRQAMKFEDYTDSLSRVAFYYIRNLRSASD